MKFKNEVSFKHGKLKRGELCRYRNSRCIYMGSYQECDYGWVHMLKVLDIVYMNGMPINQDCIIQCSDKSEIICKVQEIPVEEGQMQLC